MVSLESDWYVDWTSVVMGPELLNDQDGEEEDNDEDYDEDDKDEADDRQLEAFDILPQNSIVYVNAGAISLNLPVVFPAFNHPPTMPRVG
ncbi:hypothetical protein P153DRAFT_394950 [Dothidotthia symphoricarpi CBS 119687]|uniref:Uncharacterized protein n=1 Tax=Dothidotthia symphoricarpi CBS 119687 TaxID=1392245 RepID=A0A6A6AKL6_9PLEO|nr:uncharacterized protein P153DRAFT_394950 [Dothidotthia symphoricarpi CBS 119687]KAF2131635.1 hypothetical protein P153DRAFT_394950 [Dothidotthia symphoricarpi CBS 119687]